MQDLSRRRFMKLLGAAGGATLFNSVPWSSVAWAKSTAHVVIVGGGFGGATCANYLKRYNPTIKVTLVEPKKSFVTCPMSNTVLAGMKNINFITQSYAGVRNKGVTVVHDRVSEFDSAVKKIKLAGGTELNYDFLVLSTGVAFRWAAIENYNAAASEIMPHAWNAGAQTILLHKQLVAMKDGGVVIIATPQSPFRAPPAPFERASLIAHYLKHHKPKSKVLLIDSGKGAEELKLFKAAWQKLYPGMIEWIKGSAQGEIQRVDTKTMTVFGRSGDSYKGDVINVIPPQQAGGLCTAAGLADSSGWCGVNPGTFESKMQNDVYVIGDSAAADPMPKTGHSANTQAKICAAAIVSKQNNEKMPEVSYTTSIYSLIAPRYAISQVAVYRLKEGKITKVSGGISPKKASRKTRLKEAKFAFGWYKGIISDTFANS